MHCSISINEKFQNPQSFDDVVKGTASLFENAFYGTAGGAGFVANYLEQFPKGMLKYAGNGKNFDFILPGDKVGIRYVIRTGGYDNGSPVVDMSMEKEIYIVDTDEIIKHSLVKQPTVEVTKEITQEDTQEYTIYTVSCSCGITYSENLTEGYAELYISDNIGISYATIIAKTSNGRQCMIYDGYQCIELETMEIFGLYYDSEKEKIAMGNNILIDKTALTNSEGVIVDTFEYLRTLYGETIKNSVQNNNILNIANENVNLTQKAYRIWK